MPPLREHMEDLPAMVEAMVSEMNQKHGRRVSGVSASMLDRLMAHQWPGNARDSYWSIWIHWYYLTSCINICIR